MTSDHSALLASVLARPRDDAPRLVIADWYREHGYEELADFIGWQVANREFGTCLYDPEMGGFAGPAEHLHWFKAHAEEVIGERTAWRWVWRRGFVDELSMPGDAAAFDLGAVRKVWPVTRVTVTEYMTDEGARMLDERLGRRGRGKGLADLLGAVNKGVRFVLKIPTRYRMPEGFRASIAYAMAEQAGRRIAQQIEDEVIGVGTV